jgi:hypothetical protein
MSGMFGRMRMKSRAEKQEAGENIDAYMFMNV